MTAADSNSAGSHNMVRKRCQAAGHTWMVLFTGTLKPGKLIHDDRRQGGGYY